MKSPTAKILNQCITNDARKGWTDIILKYGEHFKFQGNLITANPDLVHQLLHNRKHTRKRSKFYLGMARLVPGSEGILFQEGDIWQERIKQVMPVFTKVNVQSYHRYVYEAATRHSKNWHSKGYSDDVYLDVTNLGVEIVLKLGYGLDREKPISQTYGTALRDYKLATMYETHRVDQFGYNILNIRNAVSLIKGLYRLKKRVRSQRVQVRQILNENLADANRLNWIRIFQAVNMPLKRMTNELNHIYGAFNAIDYVLTCALYAFSAYPERCHAALLELENTTFEDLQKSKNPEQDFPEIVAFMRESFRFFPVATMVMRRTGETIKAAGKTWQKGSEVMIFLQSMHFHPDYWDQPFEFNPARFKTALKEPKAYIPFLAGPRRCIGQHLAESHFLFALLGIVHAGLPKIDVGDFAIQPYMIPRLVNKLRAKF